MKFSKQYIKKVISEETTNYLKMTKKVKRDDSGTKLEALRKDLIHMLINYREKATKFAVSGSRDAKKSLEKEMVVIQDRYGLEHLNYQKFLIFCLHILDGRVDPQLLTFVKSIARSDRRFEPYFDKLDNYGMTSTPAEEKHSNQIRDPDPGFMRVPKSDNAVYDQEDVRRDRKTLTQS